MTAPIIRIRCAAIAASLLIGAAPPASARPDARSALARGIEALHFFEYEQANEAFREAQRVDAGLVMACWGEALTYHQTLWHNEDVPQARAALARCGPTPAARAAKARSPEERMLLEAAEALFGAGDAAERRRRYAAAMANAYSRAP